MSDDLTEDAATKDRLFREPRRIDDFNFGTETAAVFDDKLDRSLPFYDEIQRMVGELAADLLSRARPSTTSGVPPPAHFSRLVRS